MNIKSAGNSMIHYCCKKYIKKFVDLTLLKFLPFHTDRLQYDLKLFRKYFSYDEKGQGSE